MPGVAFPTASWSMANACIAGATREVVLQEAMFDGVSVTSARVAGLRWITYGPLHHALPANGRAQPQHGPHWWLGQWLAADQLACAENAGGPARGRHHCPEIPGGPFPVVANSYNAGAFSERSYAVAVQGFPEHGPPAHPVIPMCVITAVLCLLREDKPRAIDWTLADRRNATADVILVPQNARDHKLHLIDGATVRAKCARPTGLYAPPGYCRIRNYG